ncbi:MAG TPA: hypothetical protein VH253_18995 [Phycisphaerae bacterium]|nr:hypothetical protein [Phycisphaerae bacterium]
MRRLAEIGWWSVLAAACLGQATAPAKLPMPSAAAQDQAQKLIHDLFKKEYARTAAADRVTLAKALLAQAPGTKDDPAARYMLFIEAANLAANAGDAGTAIEALTAVSGLYEVNGIALKTHALIAALQAATPEEADKTAGAALAVAEEAAATDDFGTVGQLVSLAEAAGNKTKRVAVVAALQPRIAEMRALAAEYGRVKEALERLKSSPEDAEAHLAVGTFYGLHKGQWAVGLPHLARGSDKELASLARKELGHPADGAEQVKIGDAWWSIAENQTGRARRIVEAHAREWYRTAKASLEGLTLTRIESRLGEEPGAAPATVGGAKPLAEPGSAARPVSLTGGRVDLLGLVDPGKDAVSGTWRSGGGLTVASDRYALLQLPFAPPEEYDLAVTFTRTAGDGSLAVLLASHRKSFGFALDVKGEARFERVGNKIAKDNPTSVPVVINNGQAYVLTIQVRNDHVAALLDGKPLTQWKTDYKDMARYALWKMNDDSLCGLGANGAGATFSAVVLTEVSGKGKAVR